MTKRYLFGASLAVLFPTTAKGEDIQVSAARVAEAWRDVGAPVARDVPRFLGDGETLKVIIPAGPAGPPSAEPTCQTVAFIGARGLSFHASLSSADPSDERVSSVAGVLELSSCGTEPFVYVWLKSDAGRGALETVVGWGHAPLVPPSTILLERTGGVLPSAAEPGALPPLPLPEKRAEVAEARARRDGAKTLGRETWKARSDGRGEGRVVLEAGCHRVELFAEELRLTRPFMLGSHRQDPRPRTPRLDLDATMRDEEGLLLSHDHTSAPDAHMDFCVGESTPTLVEFEGAPAESSVIVTHAWSPLLDHLPLTWGQKARARMAAALWPRHVMTLEEDAVFLVQGASGVTPIPVEVEPGACYVAVVALDHGHARGLGLRVNVGARESVDERGTNDDASAVAFCTGDRSLARLEVDARSTGVSWGLALFRVASRVWERP